TGHGAGPGGPVERLRLHRGQDALRVRRRRGHAAAVHAQEVQGRVRVPRAGEALLAAGGADVRGGPGHGLRGPRARAGRRLREERAMPKYVIERDLPGAGKLSSEQLQGISQKSCGVLKNLGPQIQWVTSYV